MDSRDPGPFVLFMGFPSKEDPALVAWLALRERVADAAGASPGPDFAPTRDAQVDDRWLGIWRLLAPNNREIARSAFIYGSFTSARGNVLLLKETAPEMLAASFHGPTGGTHGWYVTVGSELAFTCARWYETAQLSLEAAAGAIRALGGAFVAEAPHQFPSRRRNRAVELVSK